MESERLFRLVEDLLVLTRAERGQFAVEAEPLELRRLLARVVAREQARLPGLTIKHRDRRATSRSSPASRRTSSRSSGTCSRTPPSTPRRAPRSSSAPNRRTPLSPFACSISGPGIDPAAAERAFELFYRDPDRARSVAGSGIGLFVCASLVEAMGGTIWAQPRPEGGAEFGFTLRVLPDDELMLAQQAAAGRRRGGVGSDPD